MVQENEVGEHLGTVKWKFGRAEGRNSSINANSQVSVNTIDGIERGGKYVAKMNPANGKGNSPFDGPVTFVVEIYETDTRFTVPVDVMRKCNLKPGHCVTVFVYEYAPSQEPISTDTHSSEEGLNKVEKLSEKVAEMEEIIGEMKENE